MSTTWSTPDGHSTYYTPEEQKQLNVDQDGRPTYPGFESALDANGNLPASFRSDPGSRVDSAAMDAYKRRAMATGASPWASMMLDKRALEQSNALQDADARGASGAAQARTQLAARGGLTGGARERVAQAMGRERMATGQDIRRQGEISRYDILTKDDQQKNDMLGRVPGMEDSRNQLLTQAEQFNATNNIGEKRAGDLARINEYNEKMKGWAADRTAQAQENSGKK
jgi:hypothetical protein